MNFKGYAELVTTLPDDIVEEEGTIVTFPGRNVAEAMAEILHAAGYDVGPPECMHEHGWDLNVHVGGRRIWLELQGVDPGEFILQTEAKVGAFKRLLGVDLRYYAEFLTKLNDGLRADARFSKVEWYELRSHMPVGRAADDPLKVMDWRE
jgi:hypothetical protein